MRTAFACLPLVDSLVVAARPCRLRQPALTAFLRATQLSPGGMSMQHASHVMAAPSLSLAAASIMNATLAMRSE